MKCRVERSDVQRALASAGLDRSTKDLSPHLQDTLIAWSATCAPPGKHDVSLCPSIEAEWREVCPAIVAALIPPDRSCVLWAFGPMEPMALPRVFPHMLFEAADTDLFHIAPVTVKDEAVEMHSWISFRFHAELFRRLLADQSVDLELTRLAGVVAETVALRSVIDTPVWKLDLTWLLENEAILFGFHRHFEGCYVLGARGQVDAAINAIQAHLCKSSTDSRGDS